MLLLRFRTTKPTCKSFKYVSYQLIATILNLTRNEVDYICKHAL